MSPARNVLPREGGFVLVLVVLMLFAISVAGAAGYLVVNTEFSMARYSDQGAEAETIARAALNRFIAEQLGVVGDSVSYAIGNGVGLITSRKLFEADSLNHLYYIRSEGTVTDAMTPTPARRVIGAYAYHRKRPLKHFAAVMVAADQGYSYGATGNVDGNDQNTSGDCAGGGLPATTGIIARTATGAQAGALLNGSPTGETWTGGFNQIYDSVALRWDILSDPSFPIEFDGAPPNFASLPADSFPVVRMIGPLAPGSSWSGRGVLIVTGKFDPGPSFNWDGIVLAGEVDDINQGNIRGMLVGALNGPNLQSPVYWYDTVRYYSCYVHAANESLSYLELVENTEFEAL
ncbi:MAG: hypothetical protein OEO79_03815 [Gemmatimonadota bacterium]|nr:hypothetical protein [Gemmatimonadota bacterium]MDH3423384.1 hypothetical protein [Gemmatimonadota bacterium]